MNIPSQYTPVRMLEIKAMLKRNSTSTRYQQINALKVLLETFILYLELPLSRTHGPLARYAKLRMRMRRECRERFPRHRM